MCPLIGAAIAALILRLGAIHPILDESIPYHIIARPVAHP